MLAASNATAFLFGLEVHDGCPRHRSRAHRVVQQPRCQGMGRSVCDRRHDSRSAVSGAAPRPRRLRKDIDDFLGAFPDMQFTVANVVGTAELVALEGVGVGTHRGPMETPGGAIPPTNRSVSMPFAAFVRLNSDGLIAEERRYYDVAGMLQQLGLLSEPAA